MEKNSKLSNELQAIRNATDNFESMHNNSDNEPKTNLMPDSNVADRTKIIASKSAPNDDDDLPELLNEAKLTIIQLQDDVNSFKAQIEKLRKQNHDHVIEIKEFKEKNNDINEFEKSIQTSLVGRHETIHKYHQETGGSGKNTAPPIPLEPIIIVNYKNERRNTEAIHDSVKVEYQRFTICSLHNFILFSLARAGQ